MRRVTWRVPLVDDRPVRKKTGCDVWWYVSMFALLVVATMRRLLVVR